MFSSSIRIFVSSKPIDLRVSFDRLAGIVRDAFGEDPRSGALFIFLNKSKDKCKILFFERSGYCLLYKRLDKGTFSIPPHPEGAVRVEVPAALLQGFLLGASRLQPSKIPQNPSSPFDIN